MDYNKFVVWKKTRLVKRKDIEKGIYFLKNIDLVLYDDEKMSEFTNFILQIEDVLIDIKNISNLLSIISSKEKKYRDLNTVSLDELKEDISDMLTRIVSSINDEKILKEILVDIILETKKILINKIEKLKKNIKE